MLNDLLCAACPLGPKPHQHAACKRCVADVQGIADRQRLIAEAGDVFTYKGVNLAAAMEYNLLPLVLPVGDPACT